MYVVRHTLTSSSLIAISITKTMDIYLAKNPMVRRATAKIKKEKSEEILHPENQIRIPVHQPVYSPAHHTRQATHTLLF